MQPIGRKLLPALILMGLSILFLHKLATLEFIGIGHVEDHLRLFYPYRMYDAQMLKSLKIPLWNPYTLGGFPYLASLRCHIFYPLNLIFLVLPTHIAMNLNYIMHIFLSGLFMYTLSKVLRLDTYSSLVSGVSFMFSGFLIDKVSWGHLTMLGSACWLPLIFLLYIKAVENSKMVYALGAAIIFGIQLFSGHPQLPYYGLLALFFFTLYSFVNTTLKQRSLKKAIRPMVYFLVLVTVGLGLTAVQFIPASEIASHSVRSSLAGRFAFFTRWSMEFTYVATFILPRLSPIIGTNSFPFPISLGYIGILPLSLAAISLYSISQNKYVPFFWFIALLAVIFALGRYTPIYYLFYRDFPGFDSFRNPVLFLYLYVFSISVLSGFGMAYLQSNNWIKSTNKLRIIIVPIALICLLLFLIASMTYALSCIETKGIIDQQDLPGYIDNSQLGFFGSLWTKTQEFRVTLIYDVGIMAFMVAGATLIFVFWNRLGKEGAFQNIVIISLIFLELLLYGRNHIQVYDLTPFVSGGKWVDYLKDDKELYRVLPILPYPEQDPILKVNKISSINGYGSLEILQNYVDFVSAFQEQPVVQDAVIARVASYNSQAINLFNTKYILTDRPIENDQFKIVFTDEIPNAKAWDPDNKETLKLRVYENKAVLPRAFIVHSAEIIKDRTQVLAELKDSNFNPRDTIILEEEPQVTPDYYSLDNEAENASFISYDESELTLMASLSRGGFLFLSEIYYPGWKAFVDNTQTEIYRANYLFRAIYVKKGFHIIRFVFDPSSYKFGRLITIITLSFLIIYFSKDLIRRLFQSTSY